MDCSTTGNHLDVRSSFGVLAQTGGEGSGNAEFFGEALSKEGVCSGSLVFVPMSSWKVQATTLTHVAIYLASQRVEEGHFGRVQSIVGVSVEAVV